MLGEKTFQRNPKINILNINNLQWQESFN